MISVRTITVGAMLVAIGVVLSMVRIPLSTLTEVTLTGIPIAVGGFLFGPVMGFIIGAMIDVTGFIVAPKGPFFPGFTISTGLIGMIYGLFLYRKWWDKKGAEPAAAQGAEPAAAPTAGKNILHDDRKGLAVRVVISHVIKTLAVSLCLNCIWLSLFYGMAFVAVFIASLPKELINIPIESFLIYSVIRLIIRSHVMTFVI